MLGCGSVVAGDQIHGDFVQELSGKDAEPGRAHARGMHCGGGRCVGAYTFIGRFLGAAVVVGDKGRCSGCGGGGLYEDPRHFRQRPPEKIPIFGLCEPAPILSIEGVLSLRLRSGPAGPSF